MDEHFQNEDQFEGGDSAIPSSFGLNENGTGTLPPSDGLAQDFSDSTADRSADAAAESVESADAPESAPAAESGDARESADIPDPAPETAESPEEAAPQNADSAEEAAGPAAGSTAGTGTDDSPADVAADSSDSSAADISESGVDDSLDSGVNDSAYDSADEISGQVSEGEEDDSGAVDASFHSADDSGYTDAAAEDSKAAESEKDSGFFAFFGKKKKERKEQTEEQGDQKDKKKKPLFGGLFGKKKDSAEEAFSADSAADGSGTGPNGTAGPAGPEGWLDDRGKKMPGLILTGVVTACVLGSFIYSFTIGDRTADQTADAPVEEETLAIADDGESEAAVETGSEIPEAESSGPEIESAETGAAETEAAVTDGAQALLSDQAAAGDLSDSQVLGKSASSVVSIVTESPEIAAEAADGSLSLSSSEIGSGVILAEDDNAYYVVTDSALTEGKAGKALACGVLQGTTSSSFLDASLIYESDTLPLSVLRAEKGDFAGTDFVSLPKIAAMDSVLGSTVTEVSMGFAPGDWNMSSQEADVAAAAVEVKTVSSTVNLLEVNDGGTLRENGGAIFDAEKDGALVGLHTELTAAAADGASLAFSAEDARAAVVEALEGSGELPAGNGNDAESASEEESTEAAPEAETMEAAEDAAVEDTAAAEPASESADESGEVRLALGSDGAADSGEELKNSDGFEKDSEAGTDAAEEASPEEGQSADTDAPADRTPAKNPGLLGIRGATLTEEYQIVNRMPAGVLVAEVVDGSGAQAAGLVPGDIITGIAGLEVQTIEDLQGELKMHEAGETVDLDIIRQDANGNYTDEETLKVTLSGN